MCDKGWRGKQNHHHLIQSRSWLSHQHKQPMLTPPLCSCEETEMDCDKSLTSLELRARPAKGCVLRGRHLGLAKLALTNGSKEQCPWPGCSSSEEEWEFPALQRRQCPWHEGRLRSVELAIIAQKMAQPSHVCQDVLLSFIAAAVWWQVKVATALSDE